MRASLLRAPILPAGCGRLCHLPGATPHLLVPPPAALQRAQRRHCAPAAAAPAATHAACGAASCQRHHCCATAGGFGARHGSRPVPSQHQWHQLQPAGIMHQGSGRTSMCSQRGRPPPRPRHAAAARGMGACPVGRSNRLAAAACGASTAADGRYGTAAAPRPRRCVAAAVRGLHGTACWGALQACPPPCASNLPRPGALLAASSRRF